jgi:hypothetical protein
MKRDFRLYYFYTRQFGLTFIPKGLDADQWEAATELMLRALHNEGPAVTFTLIEKYRWLNQLPSRPYRKNSEAA